VSALQIVVDTNNDLTIVLPFEFMGTLSNTNPYCGRFVMLYNPPTSGTTVQATVREKCMGCDIDYGTFLAGSRMPQASDRQLQVNCKEWQRGKRYFRVNSEDASLINEN